MIKASVEVTVPLPVRPMVRVKVLVKVATVMAGVVVMLLKVQLPAVPAQPPVQLTKALLAAGVSTKVRLPP